MKRSLRWWDSKGQVSYHYEWCIEGWRMLEWFLVDIGGSLWLATAVSCMFGKPKCFFNISEVRHRFQAAYLYNMHHILYEPVYSLHPCVGKSVVSIMKVLIRLLNSTWSKNLSYRSFCILRFQLYTCTSTQESTHMLPLKSSPFTCESQQWCGTISPIHIESQHSQTTPSWALYAREYVESLTKARIDLLNPTWLKSLSW